MLSIPGFKKYFAGVVAVLLSTPLFAAGGPGDNPLFNPLAVLLISLMIILMIAIGVLGSILSGAGDIHLMKRRKQEETKKSSVSQAAAIFIGCMILSPALFAQDKPANNVAQTAASIGGLTPSVFYLMVSVIFLELLVILVLLVNVRLLIRSQQEKLVVQEAKPEAAPKKAKASWWTRFNKLKPLEQEADLDLGHEYDGIRELNNRLPPWWIYGFYATILFAGIYLWRYHVSHSAPLSREEYEIAVQKADLKIKDYLKNKGDAVDENSVTMLGSTDIAEGRRMFELSCVACHNQGGAGNVGPNLTDDYWLHGGDIKSVFKTIKYGINAMPTWQNSYSNKQIAQLASYVKSLHGSNPPNPKAPQGELYKEDNTSKPAVDSVNRKEVKIAAK